MSSEQQPSFESDTLAATIHVYDAALLKIDEADYRGSCISTVHYEKPYEQASLETRYAYIQPAGQELYKLRADINHATGFRQIIIENQSLPDINLTVMPKITTSAYVFINGSGGIGIGESWSEDGRRYIDDPSELVAIADVIANAPLLDAAELAVHESALARAKEELLAGISRRSDSRIRRIASKAFDYFFGISTKPIH